MSALQYAQLDAVYKPNSEAALRGLDFALAMAQRFANGTEFNPERDAAERAYSAAMTAAAEMRQVLLVRVAHIIEIKPRSR